jgi:hypothetical protein
MNLSHGKKKKHPLSEIRPTGEILESSRSRGDKSPPTFLGHGKSFEARAKRKAATKAKIRIVTLFGMTDRRSKREPAAFGKARSGTRDLQWPF